MNHENTQERGQFRELIEGIFEVRGKPKPGNVTVGIWYQGLQAYSLPAIRSAITRYFADPALVESLVMPVPRDMLRYLDPGPQRIGGDEAWAKAFAASDERETVIWTDEIEYAWGVANAVFDPRNPTAARMAFREAYDRTIAENQSRPPEIKVSLGFDLERRVRALTDGVLHGMILVTYDAVLNLPPPQRAEVIREAVRAGMLAANHPVVLALPPTGEENSVARLLDGTAPILRLVADNGKTVVTEEDSSKETDHEHTRRMAMSMREALTNPKEGAALALQCGLKIGDTPLTEDHPAIVSLCKEKKVKPFDDNPEMERRRAEAELKGKVILPGLPDTEKATS